MTENRTDQYPSDIAARYGVSVHDTRSIGQIAALRESVDHSRVVDWADPELKRVLRFRLVGCSREFPFWDVSYVYGELKDGTRVRVQLPFHQLSAKWKENLLKHAVRDGVYAKRLGFFDPNVFSTVRD